VAKGIPDKCKKCAMLSAEQAQIMHGEEGDRCWNPAVCYSRRSYARHRDRRNQVRSQKRTGSNSELSVSTDEFNRTYWAVLVVYRRSGADTPIHAIGAEVWQGQEKFAVIHPIHCAGMIPAQVHAYVERLLQILASSYQIQKFASQERLDPSLCRIRPCPCHPELFGGQFIGL
jgi:hypothetical protein